MLGDFSSKLKGYCIQTDDVVLLQGGTEARYQNYVSIFKNLTFSKLPWYDLQVCSDEDEQHAGANRQAQRLAMDNGSDSASELEYTADTLHINETAEVRGTHII